MEQKTENTQGEHWLEQPEKDLHFATRETSGGMKYTVRELRGLSRSREEALSDWVGPERAAQVRAAFRPLHDNVGSLVDKVLSCVQSGDPMILSRLEDGWTALFGAQIAAVSRPLSVKDGHLQIEVRDSTFLYMFKHQRRDFFLEKLSAFTGGTLKSIDFVPQGARRWQQRR